MTATEQSTELIHSIEAHGANNYKPLPIVVMRAHGVWVEDTDGNRYIDMLSAYSALNQGHRHPHIIAALFRQAEQVTLTSRAFHHNQLAPFYSRLTRLTKKQRILPMNTGTEAVETALKAARRYAYDRRGIAEDTAEIIVFENNFHGRTITAVSMSSNASYQRGFGPLTPGFRVIPYGNLDALERAISPNTAAVLMEPIQGEAGIIIPPDGFVAAAFALCRSHGVLFMADEIQTGFGRTGRMFACDWENVVPDVYILGKALGGGVLPISAIAADDDVMSVFEPGSHGSTFGGNPLACAVASASLDVIVDHKLAQRAEVQGQKLMAGLRTIENPHIQEIRGRGLLIGVVLDTPARPYCERLLSAGVLCKETHDNVIRFAPPLTIQDDELAEALTRIRTGLSK